MTAPETHFPPPAPAPGRLRQPRAWPYASRPAETAPPANDFLRMLPEPALAAGLPAPEPKPKPAPEREALTAIEAFALAPVNRTYWFDL